MLEHPGLQLLCVPLPLAGACSVTVPPTVSKGLIPTMLLYSAQSAERTVHPQQLRLTGAQRAVHVAAHRPAWKSSIVPGHAAMLSRFCMDRQ